jgi:hypothetical protein
MVPEEFAAFYFINFQEEYSKWGITMNIGKTKYMSC